MKKISRILSSLLLVVMLFVTGCEFKTTRSYTYKVDTGDNIVIKLITNDGYRLTPDNPFAISKDNEVLSQGIFVEADYYNTYKDSIKENENAEIIEEGTKENCSYVMWNFPGAAGTEYNYIVRINGTNTAVVLANLVSEESAKECFNRLEIKAQ